MLDKLNKTSFSPYFIFIKQGFKMSDDKILETLKLDNYRLITTTIEQSYKNPDKCYLFLAEDNQWTHLMDDWSYSLWFNKKIEGQLKFLSKHHEIFSFSIGDIDDSYGFKYFNNGEIIREFTLNDVKSNGVEIIKDLGKPFDIEKTALKMKNPYKKLRKFAQHFGISIKYTKDDIRIYGRIEKELEKFSFNQEEY